VAEEEPKVKEVTYKFAKANDCRTIYVNGVWGGVNFPNEIRMELFNDLSADPESLVYEILPEGLGNEIKRTPPIEVFTIIREIQIVAIMSPAVARYIGNWLLTQADQAEGISK
jgi:hypothetical protein